MINCIEMNSLQPYLIGIAISLLIMFTIYSRIKGCQYYISLLSFILSCIACFIIPLFKLDITSNDYSSIIVGLMGICATFLVGFQIYSSIDTKNTINKLNESFKEQIEKTQFVFDDRIRDVKVLHNRLKIEFDEIEKIQKKLENDISNAQLQINLHHCNIRIVQGIAINENQPLSAFWSFYCAMKYAILANDYKSIELVKINMERLYNTLIGYNDETLKSQINDDDEETISKLLSINLKNMPNNEYYIEIQDRFELIVKTIVDKINKLR